LLETNDGRLHKEQAFEVMGAGKPLFIDKPVAADFKNVRAIYQRAREMKIPLFSASSLRYSTEAQQVRYENAIGKVLGADTFSPATIEPHHADLFWYGIHGVEMLFTVMGPGCESVTRFYQDKMDVVVGVWSGGRLGTFRGTRDGTHDYGGTAYGAEKNMILKPADGYTELLKKIADFFTTKKSPVDENETLEIYGFMQAADESRRKSGATVKLKDVMN
jgi:predicted dehydrogenase